MPTYVEYKMWHAGDTKTNLPIMYEKSTFYPISQMNNNSITLNTGIQLIKPNSWKGIFEESKKIGLNQVNKRGLWTTSLFLYFKFIMGFERT